VPERGVDVDKDEGARMIRADKRRAFMKDQSHSFIVGATVRMVAWAYRTDFTCTNGVII
jgi:hypothetical protein